MFKIAFRCAVGWFFFSDLGYSTKQAAIAAMDKESPEYRKGLFLVSPDGKGGWFAVEES